MEKISFSSGKKYFVAVVAMLVLIVAGLGIARNWPIAIRFDDEGRVVEPHKAWYESYLSFSERLVDWETRLQALEAQDKFGGATPEETLKAFVEALKAGDTELASRYFVISDQEKELKKLTKLSEEQVLDYISVLEMGDNISCSKDLNWCELNGEYQGTSILVARFKYIEQSSKWKIESL